MRTHPHCQHVLYDVSSTGRVTVRTLLPGSIVGESREFRNMRVASKFMEKNLFCGKKGATFLALGKDRGMDLYWAQARLNGVRAPKRRR